MAEKRIGIFAGSFNPIHAGHITLALKAIDVASLDMVYLMPERLPRHKSKLEHFGHRSAMISRAIRPHSKLALLELPERRFDVAKTLTSLERRFVGDQLVLLMGSDVVLGLKDWPGISKLLSRCELIIGMRDTEQKSQVVDALTSLPVKFKFQLIDSHASGVSSSSIRQALARSTTTAGLLPSIADYARSEWLYVSIPTGEQ
jgi:nicotinate-nucleotide adenylyltransferase